MIFFLDKNNPNYIAAKKFREESQPLLEASDEERLAYVNKFLEEFYAKYGMNPASLLVERLGNFVLRPYIGDKKQPYKILSVYSLERREAKQTNYIDEMKY